MSRRGRILALVALTVVLAVTVFGVAGADYQGTSLYDNVSPESQVTGLSERHPSARYGLDYHISAGVTSTDLGPLGSVPSGVDVDGIPALVMHTIASGIWDFTRFMSSFIITVFTFAFSLDLIGGANGVLRPITKAVSNLYNELGSEWLAVFIAIIGGWVAWRALVLRDIPGTFGKLATSMFCVTLAMLVITQPGWTIGGASRYSNELSNAVLGAVNGDDAVGAKTAAADSLFETLIYNPWVVLTFGGMVHCVDADNKPVKPASSDCVKKINNKTKYAERWLKAGTPNGKARTLEYNAIKDGKGPSRTEISEADMPANSFDGYTLSDADKPAVDIQQQPIAAERVGYAGVILIGSLGAWLLIGGLSLGVIMAQVLALLFFAFAPIMLLVAIFPGAGHRAFRLWAERLIFAITKKVWYALLLAVVLAIANALTAASADLGWLLAFGLETIFFWAVFLNRKELYGALVRALPGSTGADVRDRSLGQKAQSAYYTTRMAKPAIQAAAGLAGEAATAVGAAIGVAGRGGRAVAGTVGEGARTATDMAAGGDGHTARMVGAAALGGRAIDELEHEHSQHQERLSSEHGRRARIDELTSRQRMAHDDAAPGAGDVALSPQEQAELVSLQSRRMGDQEYEGLRDHVTDVELRRQDNGGVAFTEAQVAERAALIADRDTQEAAQAGRANGSGRPRRRRGASRPKTPQDYADLAERARRYSQDEHAQIFGGDSDDELRDRARRVTLDEDASATTSGSSNGSRSWPRTGEGGDQPRRPPDRSDFWTQAAAANDDGSAQPPPPAPPPAPLPDEAPRSERPRRRPPSSGEE